MPRGAHTWFALARIAGHAPYSVEPTPVAPAAPRAGLAKLGCDSLDKLKAKLPGLRAEMQDPDKFRQIYNYAYLFSRCAPNGGKAGRGGRLGVWPGGARSPCACRASA